jgi:hypothetical protein
MRWYLPPTLQCTTRSGTAADDAFFIARICTNGGAADQQAPGARRRLLDLAKDGIGCLPIPKIALEWARPARLQGKEAAQAS